MNSEYREYEIGDIIEIKYKGKETKAKILDITKMSEDYGLVLLINNGKISFSTKDIGIKVLDLDELGIKLVKD
ncbi:MAG: hypothetical protein ACPLXC_00700 [Candidatus Pacearchaeota archaeon]